MRSTPTRRQALVVPPRLVYRLRLSRPCPERVPMHPMLRIGSLRTLVPGQGLEPRFLGPKPSVLPLDDPGICGIVPFLYHLK